ncbi:ABC transporter permease subunit [Halorientalis halophila]|uniref:ABC transporter permease subunit n=1 Tax=Halorientalis halophila TaxID=3108499 RepID=UPI00300BE7FC
MSARRIGVLAWKDFDEAIRSRTLWASSAFLGALLGFVVLTTLIRPALSARELLSLFAVPVVWFVPIVSLVAGYVSVVGERKSGSLKLLLGVPVSRADVLLGKIVGRSGVIVVSVAVGFLVAAALSLVVMGSVPLVGLFGLFVATAVLGLVYASLAVSVSALSTTRNRAMIAAIGLYALFNLVWSGVTRLVASPVTGAFSPTGAPDWYLFARLLSPSAAYARLLHGVVGVDVPIPDLGMDGIPVMALLGARESVPVYLSGWAMLLVLAAWICVAAAVSYLRFRDADLG